jgi:Na+-transporting NADH:ubiquinone oxidoreductase subunit C
MPRSNAYVVGFAAAICVVCSLLLSVVSGSLKDRQERNRALDRQKNVLFAAGFSSDELGKKKAEEIEKLYADTFEEMVIDTSGAVMDGVKQSDLSAKEAAIEDPASNRLPIFRQKDPSDASKTKAYIYPIIGKGLWSTLYGYLAVEPDGNKIIGVAFYKHGETPGLGAEIDREWFTKNFKDKKLYESGSLVGVQVVKGKVADKTGINPDHAVDGVSGATLTCDGVTKLMKKVPKRYEPFFKKNSGRTALLAPNAEATR